MNRRKHLRFPLELPLTFKAGLTQGTGHSLNWSARGVLCSFDKPVSVGAVIELAAEWPVKLYGETPLNLAVSGSVVRNEERGVVVEIQRYEFKTARRVALRRAA